ncbi:MAG TPA: T9SS type A sorting domain-containing protein [Agriterribacter sp.]|nr:T9SS type A sorting domain-containing protein [Agriterribacter sp.]
MKKLFILSFGLLFMNHAISQGVACSNIKVISPVSAKPTNAQVSINCQNFTVQWQSEGDQRFVFTAVEKDAQTHQVIETHVMETTANTATIEITAGVVIVWQVEAVTKIDDRNFYSYPLRDGKEYLIPACAKSAVSPKTKPGALKVSGDANSKVKIYPNPFESSLSIQFSSRGTSPKIITVFDVNGKMVFTKQTAENITQLNVGQLTHGTYIIRIQDSAGTTLYSAKVVKE